MSEDTNKPNNPLEDLDPILKNAFSHVENVEKEDVNFDLQEIIDSEDSDTEATKEIKKVDFSDSSEITPPQKYTGNLIGSLPVNVSVELGRCELTINEIERLCEGSLVELNRFVGEPLDLVVNNNVVAQGEIVSVDNKFGLKIKSINKDIEF